VVEVPEERTAGSPSEVESKEGEGQNAGGPGR